MKPFHFKKFTINQNEKVFRVGTDGVLLGAFASVEKAENILEIGTGTGLISLMMAQRNAVARTLALEINLDAVQLAQKNFDNSPFHGRLRVLYHDFSTFKSKEKFDLIVSNPPYFEENSSQKDILARQQMALSFETLIKNSASILSSDGILSVIIPFEDSKAFENRCLEFGLKLQRKITIFGISGSKAQRSILEFGFHPKKVENLDFTIEKSPRVYSEEYLALTEDFHVFKKKE